MTDYSKERCGEVAQEMRFNAEHFDPTNPEETESWKAADLITALCERVTELEAELLAARQDETTDEASIDEANAILAEVLRETDAIIEPFARFLAFPPQGAWDGPNIAMGDFQRADAYRRKRFEQMRYKGGTDDR